MVDDINLSGAPWKARFNDIMYHDKEKVKKMLGTRLGGPAPVLEKINLLADLPASFDARQRWPECPSIGTNFNQGYCGSCWAVSTATAITDRTCISKKVNIRLSAQDMLSCNTVGQFGCDGGYTIKAWNYWKNTGLVTGGAYQSQQGCQPYLMAPYDATMTYDVQTPPCSTRCQPAYPTPYTADKSRGQMAYRLQNNQLAIMKEIQTRGPVTCGFTVYSCFMSYSGGVYTRQSNEVLGGHAVKVIGWGTENGVPYWLVCNSWGTNWGENGNFKIIRGINNCGFEQECEAGLP
jgi:cathepsin B